VTYAEAPPHTDRIAPDDFDALVAYLRSLRPVKRSRVG
jgi:hypothetical protein